MPIVIYFQQYNECLTMAFIQKVLCQAIISRSIFFYDVLAIIWPKNEALFYSVLRTFELQICMTCGKKRTRTKANSFNANILVYWNGTRFFYHSKSVLSFKCMSDNFRIFWNEHLAILCRTMVIHKRFFFSNDDFWMIFISIICVYNECTVFLFFYQYTFLST